MSTSDELEVAITDNHDGGRYEIRVAGELAGYAEYHLREDRIIFTHTQIDSSYEGKGIGSKLAVFALDDARARHLRVVPRCPFIAAYIDRHPEYADLVSAA